MKTIKQCADWRLDEVGGSNTYLLNKKSDPAWFRPIHANTDEAALVEAERIIDTADLLKPIDWSKQPHSKEEAFKMALKVREELLKRGDDPSNLRELVSTVCRVEWLV